MESHIRETFISIKFQEGPIQQVSAIDGALVWNGTTTEHIIEILLLRMKGLQEILPCEENRFAMRGLEMALQALNNRTMNRKAQKVEGTNETHFGGSTLEQADELIMSGLDALFSDGGKTIAEIKAEQNTELLSIGELLKDHVEGKHNATNGLCPQCKAREVLGPFRGKRGNRLTESPTELDN